MINNFNYLINHLILKMICNKNIGPINCRLNQNIVEYCVQNWILNVRICNKKLAHLYVKKLKLYSLFILNKILLTISIIHFNKKKIYKDVNILMFLIYNKIVYFLLKILFMVLL